MGLGDRIMVRNKAGRWISLEACIYQRTLEDKYIYSKQNIFIWSIGHLKRPKGTVDHYRTSSKMYFIITDLFFYT